MPSDCVFCDGQEGKCQYGQSTSDTARLFKSYDPRTKKTFLTCDDDMTVCAGGDNARIDMSPWLSEGGHPNDTDLGPIERLSRSGK